MQGIDKPRKICYNEKWVNKNTRNRCVCAQNINSGGQTRIGVPERLFTSAFCMLYYYSIFRIHLSRAFRIFRIRPGSSSFFLSFGVKAHTIEFLRCENKLSAVRTYATKAAAVPRIRYTRSSEYPDGMSGKQSSHTSRKSARQERTGGAVCDAAVDKPSKAKV